MNKARRASAAYLSIIAFLFLVFLVAVGCQSETGTTNSVEESAMVELQQDVVAETAVSDPVNTPTNQSQIEPTDALTTTETAVDECLACHIDKEQLIATADPEEEVISENEGEG